jgi:hypothetical protein
MRKTIPTTFVVVISILTLVLVSPDAKAQAAGGTKFRGVSLNQSIDEVQKVMAANGFKPQLVDDPVRVWGRDANNAICGSAEFKNGKAVELSFLPCYFRMDSRTTSKDLAQAMVSNFPIPKLDVGSRLQPGPARAQRITYYYGRLKTGENVEIPIGDYPKVVITPGDNAGGPVFK